MSGFPCWYFYTGDLQKEPGWQISGWQAQNLWLRMLMHLHEMPHRGKFMMKDGITPLDSSQIAKLLQMPIAEYDKFSCELLNNGVAEVIDGAMANRRMVRETELHEKKVNAGRKGAEARWQNASGDLWQNDGREIAESSPYPSYSHPIPIRSPSDPEEEKDKIARITPEQLAEEFNKIPGVKPLLLCDGKVPQTIRIKVLARLKKYPGQPFWTGFFTIITNSHFLTGRAAASGREPFHATFDWVMGPQNFDRIISGGFTNPPMISASRRLVT
jgi:hypothetical protein